jgi:hypothetical protein
MFLNKLEILLLGLVTVSRCQTQESLTTEGQVDRIVRHEHELLARLQQYNPLVETYIQLLARGSGNDFTVQGDKYFLGKARLDNGIDFWELTSAPKQANGESSFVPNGELRFLPRVSLANSCLLDRIAVFGNSGQTTHRDGDGM